MVTLVLAASTEQLCQLARTEQRKQEMETDCTMLTGCWLSACTTVQLVRGGVISWFPLAAPALSRAGRPFLAAAAVAAAADDDAADAAALAVAAAILAACSIAAATAASLS